MAPRSRRCRVSARVSIPLIPTTPWRARSSSRVRLARQDDGMRAGSRTTYPATQIRLDSGSSSLTRCCRCAERSGRRPAGDRTGRSGSPGIRSCPSRRQPRRRSPRGSIRLSGESPAVLQHQHGRRAHAAASSVTIIARRSRERFESCVVPGPDDGLQFWLPWVQVNTNSRSVRPAWCAPARSVRTSRSADTGMSSRGSGARSTMTPAVVTVTDARAAPSQSPCDPPGPASRQPRSCPSRRPRPDRPGPARQQGARQGGQLGLPRSPVSPAPPHAEIGSGQHECKQPHCPAAGHASFPSRTVGRPRRKVATTRPGRRHALERRVPRQRGQLAGVDHPADRRVQQHQVRRLAGGQRAALSASPLSHRPIRAGAADSRSATSAQLIRPVSTIVACTTESAVSRPSIPKAAASHSQSLSSTGCGAWSVATTSMVPSASPAPKRGDVVGRAQRRVDLVARVVGSGQVLGQQQVMGRDLGRDRRGLAASPAGRSPPHHGWTRGRCAACDSDVRREQESRATIASSATLGQPRRPSGPRARPRSSARHRSAAAPARAGR